MTTQAKAIAKGYSNFANSTSSQNINYIECNPNVNHRNITGFCIIFAFFTSIKWFKPPPSGGKRL
jgi:hypothetical protein